MPDVEEILEGLESDEPREAMREAQSLLESEELPHEDESRLTYGVAAAYFKLGIYGDALDWTEKTDSDRRWMLRGFCYMNLNQPENAREAFLNSARKAGENTRESLLLAAQCLASMEQYDSALDELETLLNQDLSPRLYAEIRFNQALVYEETDEIQKAKELFEDLLSDDANDYFEEEALFHLAMILEERGKISEAQEKIDRLQQRYDEDSDFYDQLENIQNRLRSRKKDTTDQLRDYDF